MQNVISTFRSVSETAPAKPVIPRYFVLKHAGIKPIGLKYISVLSHLGYVDYCSDLYTSGTLETRLLGPLTNPADTYNI